MKNSCDGCAHLRLHRDYEDHYLQAGWETCATRTGIENLKQFPFKSTGCNKFAPRTEGKE